MKPVSFTRYPFFHNPRDSKYPQALSDATIYSRLDVPGKSWRKVANFRR